MVRRRSDIPRAVLFGAAIVAVAAVPTLFNPAGQEAFDAAKAGCLELFGAVVAATIVFAAIAGVGTVRRSPLVIAAIAVAGAYLAAGAFGIAPGQSFHAPGIRH